MPRLCSRSDAAGRRGAVGVGGAFLVAGAVAAALSPPASREPRIVEPLDEAKVRVEGGMAAASAREGGKGEAPSPRHVRLKVEDLPEGASARAWLTSVPASDIASVDGVTFWISGADVPAHASVLLRTVAAEGDASRVYVSRVHLLNPYWHRVFLPFSEFYDPKGEGTYPIPRFTVEGASRVEIGFGVDGPSPASLDFGVDELGVTSRAEAEQTLGWRSFMPPSHGFPLSLERYDGPLHWKAEGGATVAKARLQEFPHEGFDEGMAVHLPGPKARVSRVLEPYGALHYYEGFGFWVKGDGKDHVLRLTLRGKDGRDFLFTTPVRGDGWKLVFAGFENFKLDREPFEVEEAGEATFGIALDPATPGEARLTLGPFRLGYEK